MSHPEAPASPGAVTVPPSDPSALAPDSDDLSGEAAFSEEAAGAAPPGSASARRRPRRIGWIIAIAVLVLALAAVATYAIMLMQRLDEAFERIVEQQEVIDTKETFSAAMHELVETAAELDGVRFATVVPEQAIVHLAQRGWSHRWDSDRLEDVTDDVRAATADIRATIEGAEAERTSNTTGTSFETTIDELGGGFVRTLVDDADALCGDDVLGCVMGDDPLTIHFDAADMSLEYMTEWLWTGIAYHEFAHVLQMTNPAPTDVALEAFGGDDEIMADCFALVYLDGWALDHRVWVSSSEYWDVEIGYGHTCDEAQRQATRTWYEQVGYTAGVISQ